MNAVTFLAWVAVGALGWAALLTPLHFAFLSAGRRRASRATTQWRRINRYVLRR